MFSMSVKHHQVQVWILRRTDFQGSTFRLSAFFLHSNTLTMTLAVIVNISVLNVCFSLILVPLTRLDAPI